MKVEFSLPSNVAQLVNESSQDCLSSILHDVFFDMCRKPSIEEISAVKALIEERPDAKECSVALDICDTAISDLTT